MEVRELLGWVLPLGLMFVMMRFGGCCGGHRHGGAHDGNHKAGGCCGGVQNKDGDSTKRV